MKRILQAGSITALAIVVSLLTLAAVAQQTDLPEPTAEDVWGYLERVQYQKNWDYWPGKQELYQGQDPHGVRLTTYVNPAALDALGRKAEQMPTGAIIVKENYSPDAKLAAVTVMYKAQEGYNPEHNDWFWLKRQPDGTVDAAGKVDGCQSCHQASQRDYLLTSLPR